jgi:hypothetical protein
VTRRSGETTPTPKIAPISAAIRTVSDTASSYDVLPCSDPGEQLKRTHNAGPSHMALGCFTHLAGNRAVSYWSDSEPASQMNPTAVAVMAEKESTPQPNI